MEYRHLGRSGLRVSPLCLGTMMFGGQTDAPTAQRIVDKAAAAGVNFVDTANAYNGGKSEEVTGAAIRATRHRWVLATKLANPVGDSPNDRGTSRRHLLQACEDSLRRLGTDHIDIYYLHKEDHDTPLSETVHALSDLVRAGKIRYFGVSNYRSWRVAEICRLCDEAGMDRPVASQPYYHALNRTAEVEHLPACRHLGLGVVTYSPLARGILTGKYSGEMPANDTRAGRGDKRMLEAEWRPESLAMAQQVKAHAEVKGLTPVAFALGWVLNNRAVTAVIGGPRTEEQWDGYVAAVGRPFDAADEALIDGLVPSGGSSTPGWIDPAYPVEGRYPVAR